MAAPLVGGALVVGQINPAAPAFEAETVTLLAAMAVQPDSTRQSLINAFIKSLKDNSLWAKLDGLYVLAAHTSQAAGLNWKNPGGNWPVSGSSNLIVANSAPFTTDIGYSGDAATQYVRPNYVPGSDSVQYSQNSASLFVWSTQATLNDDPLIGQTTRGSYIWPDSGVVGFVINSTTAGEISIASLDAVGFWHVSRTASNAYTAYKNGVATTTGTQVSATPTADDISVLRETTHWAPGPANAFGMGAGMNDTEAANLYTGIDTYMAGLGL